MSSTTLNTPNEKTMIKAFHVSCPITCRKICFCSIGFSRGLQSDKGKDDFLLDVARVEEFLKDPWLIKATENATIQVKVPKVVVSQPPVPQLKIAAEPDVLTVVAEPEEAASAQVKRLALQKQAAAASIEAEDYARRFESGELVTPMKESAGIEQCQSNAKVMCRLCFNGEYEGSERARKMLSCNCCGKKYHRTCLKSWAQNRDLFHWSSWTCPSCRTCEVCRRAGDPNKLRFCKRCDAAIHCYCQQPPHKNVGHGPYLCPKHTKCHSCGSTVPGNGLSLRWFLGCTCCDACGRLFVKNNYCPVCLKVYRDSESTPMVCCDICEKWVHCPCDGISESKYMQFQSNGNLRYVCPTCRGECSQIRSLEDAVQELWRRRDEADKDLIASLRAAAGLPTQDEIFDISPFSDDEEGGPLLLKNEYGRPLKFSLKGVGEKSPKTSKDFRKKSKKHGKEKGNEETPVSASNSVGNVDEVTPANGARPLRTIRIKNSKYYDLENKEEIRSGPKVAPAQGPKLVIHLGGRSKNATTPKDSADKYESSSPKKTQSFLGKRKTEVIESGASFLGKRKTEVIESEAEAPVTRKKNKYSSSTFAQDEALSVSGDLDEENIIITNSQVVEKDRKPSLKFKISKGGNSGNQNTPKNLNDENQKALPLDGKDGITYTRGQRSKRKRPGQDDEANSSHLNDDNTMEDFADANWILQKLGKDAAGKRVEIHQPSNNTWHRGTVTEVLEGTPVVTIAFDSGKTKKYELGKQGIRFVPQKQKH